MRKSVLSKLKYLDVHPKEKEEVIEKSVAGAIVTWIGIIITVVLLLSELMEYGQLKRVDTLAVHTTRDEKMDINFRITFLALPCEAINFDVTDRSGEDETAIPRVTKLAWKGNFNEVLRVVGKSGNLWQVLNQNTIPAASHRGCSSCHGGEKWRGQCCNNCYELKLAYAERGLDPKDAESFPQCQSEKEQPEGCLVSGSVSVNKMQGNMHVAVGESHIEEGRHHHHWPKHHRALGFNTSHYIHHFSFGKEFPGIVNPLDGEFFIETGLGQHQYFVQVVTTSFFEGNTEHLTHQYSVTEHQSVVNLDDEHIELPGLFQPTSLFKVDNNFIDLCRFCAVIGGIWVVLGLVYQYAKQGIENLMKVN